MSDTPQNKTPPDAMSMNDEASWSAARKNWAQEKIGIAQAHATAFFEANDENPLARHYLLVAILSFFLLFVVWANLAQLDEVTRGEGKIVPSTEVQALQSIEAGIIEEILVKEGEVVAKDQVLMRLQDIEASSDLGANRVRYLGLLASIKRLQAQAEGKDKVEFPAEVLSEAPTSVLEEENAFRASKLQLEGTIRVLEQQKSQRAQELDELNTRIGDVKGVISLQRQEKNMIAPLVAKGSAPKLELLQLERGIKERETELNSLESSLPRTKSGIAEAEARITEAKREAQAVAQKELTEKLREMNEIRERLAALTERKVRKEIKSPVDGTIQEIRVKTIGGVVRGGEDIIKIVPKDDQLIVEARIKPSDRAFIYPGQPAMIKVTAYDFSIYGGLKGELVDISADTLKDEKGVSYYRVRLRTFEKELIRKGQVLPIIPGMVASVDILTGKKTVMEYLLKPFVKTLDAAMNER